MINSPTPILDLIAQHPGEVAEIRDDAEAMQLLLEACIIDKFIKNPHPGRQWFSMACTSCATHYIIGVFYTDFPNAIDNGYIVHCLPLSLYSVAQAQQWAMQAYASTCKPESIVEAFKPFAKPGEN